MHHVAIAAPVPAVWLLPFVLLLAAIALMPLLAHHWWERHYPKVALIFAAVGAAYYLLVRRDPWPWLHGMQEYISFIILLGALYVVSGGIALTIARKATPLANSILLLFGAVLANILGTTGASMLLIRPYLRMNRGHLRAYHVVFFIFIVANVGGALTPIGDPPLFLGYLNGVPFWWVTQQLWTPWAVAVGLLLLIFFIVDHRDHTRQQRHHDHDGGPMLHMLGVHNFLFIAVILFAVFREGIFEVIHHIGQEGLSAGLAAQLLFSREMLMIAAAAGSHRFTGRVIYEKNEFTFGPIREVAILFLGIFSTMAPALQWLGHNANRLPLQTPGQYYFTTGALSSVLDNAPTYLTFLHLRLGLLDAGDVDAAVEQAGRMSASKTLAIDPNMTSGPVRNAIEALVAHRADGILKNQLSRREVEVAFLLGSPRTNLFLVAISIGAVFFGACTYIGNGPNFMVKSIAESAGAKMPSFLGYVVHYSLPILIPVFILIWLIFLA